MHKDFEKELKHKVYDLAIQLEICHPYTLSQGSTMT